MSTPRVLPLHDGGGSSVQPIFEKSLSELRIVYVCATGIGSRLSEYLVPRAQKLAVLYPTHPPNYSGGSLIGCSVWVGGTLRKRVDLGARLSPILRGLSLIHRSLLQLPQMLLGLLWILTLRDRFDVFIGLESVFGFWGLLLRRMGIAGKVVVWSFDQFTADGRSGVDSLFLHLWRKLDRLVQNQSDVIWYASQEVMLAKERDGCIRSDKVLRLLVPPGVDSSSLERPTTSVDRKRLVYCGRLEDDVAMELVFEALETIVDHDSAVRLTIIGTGSKLNHLKRRARNLGLDHNVEFMGFISEERKVRELLSDSGIGIAPYAASPNSDMHNAAPSKLKLYMEAGIPIVMTRISPMAREIEERRAGLVVSCDLADMKIALEKLVSDEHLWTEIRANVVAMAKEYDYRSIFNSVFSMMSVH